MNLNPFAGLIVVAAVLFFIVAWKGTQDNVISALLGRPYGNTTLGGGSGANASTSALVIQPQSTPFGGLTVTPFTQSPQTMAQGGAV